MQEPLLRSRTYSPADLSASSIIEMMALLQLALNRSSSQPGAVAPAAYRSIL